MLNACRERNQINDILHINCEKIAKNVPEVDNESKNVQLLDNFMMT
jgi:hypothetical protein